MTQTVTRKKVLTGGSVKIVDYTVDDPTTISTLTNGTWAQRDVVWRRAVGTLNSFVTMTDATTAGCHGTLPLLTFPTGMVAAFAKTDLTLTAGAGGITDTAALVASMGSVAVATDNATLLTTEADLIASTAATLSSGAAAFDGISSAVVVYDGTTTPLTCRLNFAVPDAGSTASDTLTVAGTVDILYAFLGDS